MPKRLPYLLTLLAGLLASYGFMAAKAPLAAKQYDYLTITQQGDYFSVSSPPDHFERTRVKMNETSSSGNFSPLFAKVNEYEAQGYELMTNSVYAYGTGGRVENYVLLRRPKQ